MSTNKRTATISTPILPDDLVEEILSWVPARSLKLLRSTCKRWNTLFSDHKFTKKHFDKAPKEFLVLLRVRLDVYLVSFDLRGVRNNRIDPSIELKGEFGVLGDMCPISHCNGLLLCTDRCMYYATRRLMVSNPCMGQTRSIETITDFRSNEELALGYQNEKSCSASYKILRFGWVVPKPPVVYRFEIYEFSSNSWRFLHDVNDDDWFVGPHCRGVSFKGNTYWIALDRKDYFDTFLLQFDFAKERFQRFRLPFKCDCDNDTVVLSTREEHLAVFLHRHDETTSEIWLTKKIDEPSSVPWRFLLRVNSGYEIISFLYAMSFMVDEENKIAMCFHHECIGKKPDIEKRTILSIVGEGNISIRLIGSPAEQHLRMPYLLSYVPSLVQI